MPNGSHPKALAAIIWKDAITDFRDPTLVMLQTVFSIGSGLAVGIAARSGIWGGEPLIVGGVALAMMFQSVFAIHGAILREVEANSIEALRLAPVPKWLLFTAKTFYSAANIFVFTTVFLLASLLFSQQSLAKTFHATPWLIITSTYLGIVSSFTGITLIYSQARNTASPAIILALTPPYFYSTVEHLTLLVQGVTPQSGWYIQPMLATLSTYAILSVVSEKILE